MTQTRYFNKFLESLSINQVETNVQLKDRMTRLNLAWMYNKTAEMFEYSNMPRTLSPIALERILQMNGSAVIWNVPKKYHPVGFGAEMTMDMSARADNDINLFAFPFTFADAPDPYDEPFKVIITSPGFNPTISETLEINKDVIVMRNDVYYQGLHNIHKKYAELLTEAEISLRSTLITLRDQITFVVKNERQRAEAASYMQAREMGLFASILAPDIGSHIEAIQHEGRSNAVELAVNGIQAIKAAWYNDIGLNPSFSLKREYTSAQEIDVNTDLLKPIIDDMFEQRAIACELINALFGTNISVRRKSAWEVKEKEVQLSIEEKEAEIEAELSARADNQEESKGGGESDSVSSSSNDASGGSDTESGS